MFTSWCFIINALLSQYRAQCQFFKQIWRQLAINISTKEMTHALNSTFCFNQFTDVKITKQVLREPTLRITYQFHVMSEVICQIQFLQLNKTTSNWQHNYIVITTFRRSEDMSYLYTNLYAQNASMSMKIIILGNWIAILICRHIKKRK